MAETLARMAADQAAHERAATLLGFAQHVREADALIMLEVYRPHTTGQSNWRQPALARADSTRRFGVAVR